MQGDSEEVLSCNPDGHQCSTSNVPVDVVDDIGQDSKPSLPERRRCVLVNGDARHLDFVDDASVHLVLTSPPYWNLKEYNAADEVEGQLGHVADYADFLKQLDRVWAECYRVLVPGSRLVVVVGDVLLSRKRHGRHRLVPLHSDIQIACQKIGFDCLAPIIWHKIGSAAHEVNNGRASMLGKPYEPNAIIKNDIEYILMLRKPGGYRSPTPVQRDLSRIPKADFHAWFRQIWTDVPGTRSKDHPAPFPRELAARLVRMFSFDGDTVVDPFAGSGTTLIAALDARRHAIGAEIDPTYFALAKKRVSSALPDIRWRERYCDASNDNRGQDRGDDLVDVNEPIARDCIADFIPDKSDNSTVRVCFVGTLAAVGGVPRGANGKSHKRKSPPPPTDI
ncbi:DNA adenine methyltransferase domain containing protein [Pandoravirus celtis]|uniref:site-specific DNA-methyltransferase (cytosine-N(4)-specific) n=1 Tax=Pandoravirus celtis TaxID=2568002 RepID=A0A4D6EI44_9VIRU|nr:DNA adenine methyltransferase domain containing protein [Pandoravirus celtis]